MYTHLYSCSTTVSFWTSAPPPPYLGFHTLLASKYGRLTLWERWKRLKWVAFLAYEPVRSHSCTGSLVCAERLVRKWKASKTFGTTCRCVYFFSLEDLPKKTNLQCGDYNVKIRWSSMTVTLQIHWVETAKALAEASQKVYNAACISFDAITG